MRNAKLQPTNTPFLGKMKASQMLAHANVAYEMTYESTHPRPNAFMRFLLKTFLKKSVVDPKLYLENSLPRLNLLSKMKRILS